MKNCILYILFFAIFSPVKAQFDLQFSGNYLFNIDAFYEKEFTANLEALLNASYGIHPNHSFGICGGLLFSGEHPLYEGDITWGLPIILNYNIGFGATKNATPLIGGYAGIGYQTISYNSLTQFSGFIFQTGFRAAHFLPERVRYTVLYDYEKQLFIRVFVNHENTNQRIVSCGIGFNLPER